MWCTPQENLTLGKYRECYSNWQIYQLEFLHRERDSTLLANHAFVYHYILHLLPIVINVVQQIYNIGDFGEKYPAVSM